VGQTINLPVGPPFRGCLVRTNPIQLRLYSKADQDYTLRITYIPVPPTITSASQALYTPAIYNEAVYLKFVEKTALAMGEAELAVFYRQLYDDEVRRNRFLATQQHRQAMKLNFSWC